MLPWGSPESQRKTNGKKSLAADTFTVLCWKSLGENYYSREHTEAGLWDLLMFNLFY